MLLVGCSSLALVGCGPSDIASPGTGGDVIIQPTPTPTPTATPTPTPTVTPASGCPTISDPQGLTDAGTISGPTGTWRVCSLPSVIRQSSTLPKLTGLVYQMNGRVDVGCDGGFSAPTTAAPLTDPASLTVGCTATSLTADTNVTLTIEPGVILFGGTGQSWLAVNRGNKINAVGTATKPIIFTSRDNILGLNGETSQGQWGGVVLMGRAPVTDCTAGTVAGGTCERQTEGSPNPARFGGADAAYNAGVMKYVQIRYSGFILGSNVELQSLTGEGVGTGTTIDHIQSYNSSDDGSEWFGGSPNMKYYISVGADDDSLDVDTGAQMNVQYALLMQRSGAGDALMEIDSNGKESETPRTKLAVANFTALQPATSSNNEGADLASVLLRGNSDTTWVNGLIVTPNNECVRMNFSGTDAQKATLKAFSVAMQCNSGKYLASGNTTDTASIADVFSANNNNASFISTLTSTFVNGTNESGFTAADPKSVSSFFDTTTWIGAVRNSSDTWYAGWTCNSSTADFGSGNSGDCTSLPIT
ncbi:hypothetical protein SAMN05518801_102374 [Novosphingobium sp. CF614]|uniref:hypothetical protein n=1 Tax=Novosphingobium sp. CF614 TaxID=1884364 RepID=UPI0008EDBFD9|nr:hypothetical protein SAMN05518801_102374 [Novosphingobium sp. CF614]